MNSQVFSITGKIVGIEESLNKNNEPYFKIKIGYGDKEINVNCNDKPGVLGEEVTIPYTESEFTSPKDGKVYRSKWQSKSAPQQGALSNDGTMVLLSMNKKLDEILALLRPNSGVATVESTPPAEDEIDVDNLPF